MKRLFPILVLVAIAALSPAPIKDTRVLRVQPEQSDAQKEKQMNGATMREVGVVPEVTDRPVAPPIEGSANAAGVLRQADQAERDLAAKRGAAAVREASRDLATGKPNGARFFFGGLIVVAAFGLFQVFRMWANKVLPDAPGSLN